MEYVITVVDTLGTHWVSKPINEDKIEIDDTRELLMKFGEMNGFFITRIIDSKEQRVYFNPRHIEAVIIEERE